MDAIFSRKVLGLELVIRYEVWLTKGSPERKCINEEPFDTGIGDCDASVSVERLSIRIEIRAGLLEIQPKDDEGRQLAESRVLGALPLFSLNRVEDPSTIRM